MTEPTPNVLQYPASRRRRSVSGMIVPPLIVFALGQIFIMLAANHNGFDPFQAGTWFRGDSGHYMAIATRGFEFYISDGSEGYPRGIWLGNTGWMPLYPWLIRMLMGIGISPIAAAICLPAIFHLLTLALLWNRFLRDVDNPHGFACLLLAAFFPSQIYQHAAFPISLLTLLTLISFDQLLSQRWWAAGLAGLLAAMSYATGFLLGPVIAFYLLLPPYPAVTWPTLLRRIALAAGLPMVGLGLVFLAHQISVGAWNAFFLVQANYGHGLHNPLLTFWEQLSSITNPNPGVQIFRQKILPQIIVVAVMVLAGLSWTVMRWPRRQPIDRLLVLFAVLFWIFPLVMGMGVLPLRPAACLLPIIPLARRLPVTAQAGILVVFIVLAIQTDNLFFNIMTL